MNPDNLKLSEYLAKYYYRGLKRLDARVWKVVTLHPEDLSDDYLVLPEGYTGVMLQGQELYSLTGKLPGVGREFVEQAIELENWCYAILAGGEVASAGWYAPQVPVSDTIPQYPARYAYRYRGFTHLDYRGQRLHAFGLRQSVELLVEQGLHGMIGLVQLQNHKSRRSIQRLGFKERGTVVAKASGTGGRCWHSRGCKNMGFRLLQYGGRDA